MKLLLAPTTPQENPSTLPQGVLAPANDLDPSTLDLTGVHRIDLNFPKFSDGRAFSQAFLLRRRLQFKGEIRATGDVLVDQVLQMQRTGFDTAVLRHDQNVDVAQRQLARFDDFYQGDAVQVQPLFGKTTQTQAPAPVSSLLPKQNATPNQVTSNAITLYARKADGFDQKVADTIAFLQEQAARHPTLVQASSLGAEDMVLTHLITQAGLATPAFVLETGRLHAETLALLANLQAAMGERLQVVHPEPQAVDAYTQTHGLDAIYQSLDLRKACCAIRKLEPLERALAGKNAWLTGLRREQSGNRADVPLVDESDLASKGRVKLNPLAAWTWADIWHYIALHQVPYNVLHDQFYPSIGCAPCTRAISVGEDFRSGRWWWEDATAKECGLHASHA
jgi:phosphoadenosine phosphosulfate reductase